MIDWLNQQFPCHREHSVADVLAEPLDRARQYGGRCPTCEASYRLVPRVYRVHGGPLPLIEWTVRLPNGPTVVLPPDVPDFFDSGDAPLYADPPWRSRWPQDPRRPYNGPWSLPRVSMGDVDRDGYFTTVRRLAVEADWDYAKANTHLIVMVEPVTVAGATVVDAEEVLLARRGWVRAAASSVVLASARSVNYDLVVSRGFAFVSKPVEFDISPPDGSRRLFDPVTR